LVELAIHSTCNWNTVVFDICEGGLLVCWQGANAILSLSGLAGRDDMEVAANPFQKLWCTGCIITACYSGFGKIQLAKVSAMAGTCCGVAQSVSILWVSLAVVNGI